MKNPRQYYRYGTILLWLGVLVWVPYFALQIAGENPSLMVFLPFHLAGVMGGSRMRTAARKELGIPREKRKGYKKAAHWMIIASLLVWLPYYALKLSGRPVEIIPFLAVHLTGIFSGTGLLLAGGALAYYRNRTNGVLHGVRHPTEETN